jgi:hypothetical protein
MSRRLVGFLIALVSCCASARATVVIDWSLVDHPGNAADTTVGMGGSPGYVSNLGAVNYTYSIGTFDVTNANYVEFLNAKDPAGTNSLRLYNSNMAGTFSSGAGIQFNANATAGGKYSIAASTANLPVTFVGWYDAIRFANWMNNGQGNADTETGSYTLLGGTPVPSNADSITRNSGARIVLPNQDEWYKAAYYNPAANSYYVYPTSSNTIPTPELPPGGGNSANYGLNFDLNEVGAYAQTKSPFGLYDTAGNASQWLEDLIKPGWRGLEGQPFVLSTPDLMQGGTNLPQLVVSLGIRPTSELEFIGFRLAMVPEPGSGALAAFACGALAVLGLRGRGTRARA